MGGFESTNKKKYLSQDEVEQISKNNQTLQIVFNQHKNANGVIQIRDLSMIFENKIRPKIVRKLYRICSSEKNKFCLDDLKYLYSLLHTRNSTSKINFIADLIFYDKNSLHLNKYKKKIDTYFNDCKPLYSTLLNEEFLHSNQKGGNKIFKDNFLKIVSSQRKTFFEQFNFTSELDNKFGNEDISGKLILKVNDPSCNCLNQAERPKLVTDSFHIQSLQLELMENEFKKIEKSNNGLFTISYLENILNELEINRKLISLIVSYLKKKTQKTFINFELFKILIGKLSHNREKICDYLFEMASYPNDYINKLDLFLLIKSTNPNINSSNINKFNYRGYKQNF
jgi:hypothetical protein